jgi:death-on-curing protein
MKRLTKEQVIKIHSILINQTGGIDVIKDEGLLEPALNVSFQTFDGEYIYKTIQSKAAKLGYFLIKNHAFVDGNKRIGLLVMMTFGPPDPYVTSLLSSQGMWRRLYRYPTKKQTHIST